MTKEERIENLNRLSGTDVRKCMKCGATTDNMTKTTCKCGGFMYPVGVCYVPQVKKSEKKGAL